MYVYTFTYIHTLCDVMIFYVMLYYNEQFGLELAPRVRRDADQDEQRGASRSPII